MLKRLIICLALLACLCAAASAQDGPPLPDSSQSSPQREERNPSTPHEDDIRYRAEVRHEEAAHKELLERADEAARLGAELRTSFEHNQNLTAEDLKRLERIEKLARKIRGGVGGSDDEGELKDPPRQLGPAVTRVAELTKTLSEKVKSTSRLVVSVPVIEKSNELLELIKYIRTLGKP